MFFENEKLEKQNTSVISLMFKNITKNSTVVKYRINN